MNLLDLPQHDTQFLLEVSKGQVCGHSLVTYTGHNSEVGIVEETIWPIGGSYTPPDTATQMTISSSNNNDNQVGTGLRSVFIQGLNSNWDQISETLLMHPTTGQLGQTTVNSYLRINSIIGTTAGTTGYNEGIIYVGTGLISSGVPENVFSVVDIQANNTETGFFAVPANHTAHAVQALYGGESNKNLVMNGYHRPFGGLFLRIGAFNLSNQNIPLLPFTPPSVFAEKSDSEFRGIINTQTGDIKIAITLLLIDNNFL